MTRGGIIAAGWGERLGQKLPKRYASGQQSPN